MSTDPRNDAWWREIEANAQRQQQARPMTAEEELLRRDPAAQNPSPYAQQQGLQNAQQPYNPHADPRSYGPYQPIQPLGYSPLSEADVQRIAIAVVARLEAKRGDGG